MILTPQAFAARRTLALASVLRGGAHKPRPLPRQVTPTLLEDKYTRELLTWVNVHILPAFDDLEDALPRMLDDVHAAARFDAGEGKRVRELMREAREKMNRSLHTPELERLAEKFARETSTYQRVQLGKQTKAALGADVFVSDRRLMPLMEAFVNANVGHITKMVDEVAGRIETSVLRAVQDAKPWTEFRDELQENFGFSRSRAELIARDQIGKFYGQVNASRQRELGITHFIWRTSGDERVRDEHEELNGERFSYDEPPDEGLPGEPIQCRCSAEPDFSSILGDE